MLFLIPEKSDLFCCRQKYLVLLSFICKVVAETPALYSSLVGVTQSSVFQSDLLGVDSEIKSDVKAPVKETKKRRRKEPVKKSKKNVTPLENFDYRFDLS